MERVLGELRRLDSGKVQNKVRLEKEANENKEDLILARDQHVVRLETVR